MGLSSTKVANAAYIKHQEIFPKENSHSDVKSMQMKFDHSTAIEEAVIVAHYTPSGFPLIPIISARTQKLCKSSWEKIVSQHNENGSGISHIRQLPLHSFFT